jgi:hypothetical protein
MTRLDEIAATDGWRCWVCDEVVDPDMSLNDPRGASVDSVTTKAKSKTKGASGERLAHRGCNTRRGAVTPVAPWPAELFVADAAPIIETVDALRRKGSRTVIAQCPTLADGEAAAAWLTDRVSRLSRDVSIVATVEPAGEQFLLIVRT